MYGIKVSLPGKSVDSTDPRDFAVHSEYPSPMIEESLIGKETYVWSIDLAANEERVLFTIPHGYGYKPKSAVMVTNGELFDGTEFSILTPFGDSSGQYAFESYTDGTNLIIQLTNFTGFIIPADNVTYTFKYYIFTDEAL